jgi:hypothetical protein
LRRWNPSISAPTTPGTNARYNRWHGVGDEPFGVYITAIVDVEDTDEVSDLYIHRLVEMQVEEDLPVHILTVRPMPWERQDAKEKKYRTSAA